MSRNDLCSGLLQTLRSTGFKLSMRCPAKLSCFDIVARRGEDAILAKTVCKSTLIAKEAARELAWIGSNLMATPLIVCLNGSENPMKDDTLYFRHGVPMITPETLRIAVEQGDHPMVEARPGGFYVQLDGEAVRRRREEAGLSLGELASMIGVSRRTIYGYERNLVKAPVTIALKLEATFGVPFVRQTNLFKERSRESRRRPRAQGWNPIHAEIAQKLSALGYRIALVHMAPFDFVATRNRTERIIGGVVEDTATTKIELSSSIANTLDCHSLFVTESSSLNGPGTISKEAFLQIREPEQLHKLLT